MSSSSRFGLKEIGQIAIPVKDITRSVEFYRDVLGLEFLFEAPPHLAFFQCGSVRLMLSIPEKPEFDHPSSVIYFNVPEIQQAHRSLLLQGLEFEHDPFIVHQDARHELWMAFFRDPSNNLLAISSAKMI